MGITETQKTSTEEGFPNNPFVPPKCDICFINNLPPELLSHIFDAGTADDGTRDRDDAIDPRDLLRELDANRADRENAPDTDVEMREELEEDDGGAETHDEVDSDGVAPCDYPALPFQVLVANVCRHWRDVAYSTPSLWTTTAITPNAGLSPEPGLTLLARSKGLPIDVCMHCPARHYDDPHAPSDDDVKSIFSIFIPHIHRWRMMTFGVAKYNLIYEFLSAASGPSVSSAPHLTTLELYHYEKTEEFGTFGYPSMSKHFTLFGGSAPSLTTVALWAVHIDWSQPWIASAPNLRELGLGYHAEDVRPSWAQFATILRGASALEKLTLYQSGPSGDPAEWFIEPAPGCHANLNSPVQLPRVTHLALGFHSEARAIGFLQKLHFPALVHLVLEFSDNDYTDFVRALARPIHPCLLQRAFAQEPPWNVLSRLKSLKIIGLPCSAECVGTLYGELQNLWLLNVSFSSLPPLFLDILGTRCTLTGRGDVWLPRMGTLYVSGSSGRALREVVQKRRDVGVPLGALYVEKSSEVEYEDVKWLMENVETLKFFERA